LEPARGKIAAGRRHRESRRGPSGRQAVLDRDTFEYFLDGPSTQKVQEAWSYTHGQSFFGDIYATSNAVAV
jgi:hypothetical protein